ncbi:MAG: sulfatase-like hydrolase/transferase [Verrucomicrobiales bacterium]
MKFALAILLGVIATAPLLAAPPARPNILYFYVDDMGWGSIGPNGQAQRRAKGLPYVRTPNLDRLAARGINFTRGYGCHVCSPARSSQQSGFHQGHTFADRTDPDNAKKAMRADDILMGDALSAAGYTTGYWGKWGYGGSKDMVNPTIDNIQTLPTSHGYQFALTELHHVRAHTFFQPTLWSAPAKEGAKGGLELVPNSMSRYADHPAYPESPSYHSHPDYPEPGYCDDAYALAALEFVRENAKAYNKTGKPFFGLLAAQIPHAPFDEVSKLPKWNQAYEDDKDFADLPKQAQQWAAMVTRIDAHFGNILAALEDPDGDGDTSDSAANNTLVIFQSDNGGPGGANNTVFDANGGLRGNKGSINEGGIRVPLIMRWPEKINNRSKLRAGTSSARVIDVTDLLPTFCELAGTPIPLGLDGVSIAPTLTGQGIQRQRAFIIHEAGNGQSIIRGTHKLVRSAGAGRKKKKASPPKFVLYDLEADRAEKNDIAAAHPELVDELRTLMLGERVAEPRGFANSYHHWTGDDGALTSDADNWSDYEYANAGVTYFTDDGPPQLSWTAKIVNQASTRAVARAEADLEFLGLEISGGRAGSKQFLKLGPGVNLLGRNQIRLLKGGNLSVDGGTVSSLRWLDIAEGATLIGHGRIEGDIYSSGTLAVEHEGPLAVNGHYHETPEAKLSIRLGTGGSSPLEISGHAELAGTLSLGAPPSPPTPGAPITILKAASISGEFKGTDLNFPDSGRYEIKVGYTDHSVTLTAKKR